MAGSDARSEKRKKGTLTKSEVVAAACALVEEAGPAAASMRAVAKRVGVTAMAVYGYVPSQDALLNEVCAAFLSRVDCSARLGERWEDTLVRVFSTLRVACERHPNMAQLLTHPAVGAGLEPYMMRVRGLFMSQGMPEDIAIQLVAIADSYVAGFMLRSVQRVQGEGGSSGHGGAAVAGRAWVMGAMAESAQNANGAGATSRAGGTAAPQGAIGASAHGGTGQVPAAAVSRAGGKSGIPARGGTGQSPAAPHSRAGDTVAFATASRVPGMLTGRAAPDFQPNERWRKTVEAGYSQLSFENGLFAIIEGVRVGAAPDPCTWHTPARR